jgi:hypothetical protein
LKLVKGNNSNVYHQWIFLDKSSNLIPKKSYLWKRIWFLIFKNDSEVKSISAEKILNIILFMASDLLKTK